MPSAPRASSCAEEGNRQLQPGADVWAHNAWDNVPQTAEMVEHAAAKIALQQAAPASPEQRVRSRQEAPQLWDAFYTRNENRFFKDRHWFAIEFPEIFELERRAAAADAADAEMTCATTAPQPQPGAKPVVWEVGCGAGNTLFPLLRDTQHLYVYGSDYSCVAVDVVQASPDYDTTRCQAFVYDITSPEAPTPIAPGTVDIITCVFVLSALHPDTWAQAMHNLWTALKPGGMLLLRDYGRHDLAQLRFKGGRLLADNFYCRGDGTQVYFFTQQELADLVTPRFRIVQNAVDRRLLVNRSLQLKMYVCLSSAYCMSLTPGLHAFSQAPRLGAGQVREASFPRSCTPHWRHAKSITTTVPLNNICMGGTCSAKAQA
jgi:tRNAThr (cytosine32-N3)-methyltransferase